MILKKEGEKKLNYRQGDSTMVIHVLVGVHGHQMPIVYSGFTKQELEQQLNRTSGKGNWLFIGVGKQERKKIIIEPKKRRRIKL